MKRERIRSAICIGASFIGLVVVLVLSCRYDIPALVSVLMSGLAMVISGYFGTRIVESYCDDDGNDQEIQVGP